MDSLVSYEEICAANPTLVYSTMEDPATGIQVQVPEVFIPTEIHERLCAPWRNSIIIKLLGKSISFFTLQARLHKEWKTTKDFDIIDVGLGYYVVRFYSEADCQQVLTSGPYKIFDHYLTVQPWEPNFQPARAKIIKTAVWIHLESAPMEQFTGPILKFLASTLGKPIKIDYTTMLATRGRFARVCVELDLSKTLPVCIKLRRKPRRRRRPPTVVLRLHQPRNQRTQSSASGKWPEKSTENQDPKKESSPQPTLQRTRNLTKRERDRKNLLGRSHRKIKGNLNHKRKNTQIRHQNQIASMHLPKIQISPLLKIRNQERNLRRL